MWIFLGAPEDNVLCPARGGTEERESKHARIENDIRHPVHMNTQFWVLPAYRGPLVQWTKELFKFSRGSFYLTPPPFQKRGTSPCSIESAMTNSRQFAWHNKTDLWCRGLVLVWYSTGGIRIRSSTGWLQLRYFSCRCWLSAPSLYAMPRKLSDFMSTNYTSRKHFHWTFEAPDSNVSFTLMSFAFESLKTTLCLTFLPPGASHLFLWTSLWQHQVARTILQVPGRCWTLQMCKHFNSITR